MKSVRFFVCIIAAIPTFLFGIGLVFFVSLLSPILGGYGISATSSAKDESGAKGTDHTGNSAYYGELDPSGRYNLEPNFRGEFVGFESVYIRANDAFQPYQAGALVRGTTFRYESLLIDNNEVAFQTETIKGERYIFAGLFRTRTSCGIDLTTAGIHGQLIKFIDGKIAAVMNASFYVVQNC